jgi:hypothetical protein
MIVFEKNGALDTERKNMIATSKDYEDAGGGFFDNDNTGIDCTMAFTATNVPGHFSMLNARHYNMHPKMTSQQNYRFMMDCMKEQKEGGFERMRKNSRGPPTINVDVLRGASHYNISPRKLNYSYLCIFDNEFMMMYISPVPKEDHGPRRLCKHPYSNFKRAGSFAMPPEFVTKYPFLVKFAKSKIRTAQILSTLTGMGDIDMGEGQPKLKNFKASFNAAYETLGVCNRCKELALDETHFYMLYYCMVRCTIVGYPTTTLHADAFAKLTVNEFLNGYPGIVWDIPTHRIKALEMLNSKEQKQKRMEMASLENKIGFKIPCQVYSKNPQCNGIGRGGGGPGIYVFTLLDWRNTAAYARRRFVLNNGGVGARRATRQHFEERVVAVGQQTIDQWLHDKSLHPEVRQEIREIRGIVE